MSTDSEATPVAIVTGGGGDIGRAISLRLARDGHHVAVADVDTDAAAKVCEEIAAAGSPEAVPLELQVADPDSVEAATASLRERFGRIDVLVNNAGITRDNFFSRLEISQWDEVIDVNLKGPFLCAKAVAPVMREGGFGRVVNMSSVAAVHGALTCANYCASKAGLLGLTVALAREFGRYVAKEGVDMTCNAVMPGIVDTKLSAVMPDEMRELRVAETPLARFGEPADVADTVAFFASEDSRFVTGTALRVDGGMRLAIG
jgi:3-oxoacyl-[acyl-carrier protein] reductase